MNDLELVDTNFSLGDIVRDAENGDELIVLDVSEETAGEYVAKYDFNQNVVSVSDITGCDSSETVVEVVYKENVLDRFPTLSTVEELSTLASKSRVKVYGFPQSRLEKTDDSFTN